MIEYQNATNDRNDLSSCRDQRENMLLKVSHNIVNWNLTSNLQHTNQSQLLKALRMLKYKLQSREETSCNQSIYSCQQESVKVGWCEEVVGRRFEDWLTVSLAITEKSISNHWNKQETISFPLLWKSMMICLVSSCDFTNIEQDHSKCN